MGKNTYETIGAISVIIFCICIILLVIGIFKSFISGVGDDLKIVGIPLGLVTTISIGLMLESQKKVKEFERRENN